MTDTAQARLRADIEARKPWVDYWEWHDGPRFANVYDDDGEPMTAKQAVRQATACALEWYFTKSGQQEPGLSYEDATWWVTHRHGDATGTTLYEALAAACDAVEVTP